jgi:EmrB/QacA subfamily drug resistance transporter
MPRPQVTEENRKWWTLFAISFSLFVINLDNTVVVVALPQMSADLNASFTTTEWFINSYTLVFAVLLLFGGRIADLFGRRRILLVGLAIFEVASIACGLAGDETFMVVARSIQGIGAALMLPATLSLVSASFPQSEHGMAFGIWAGLSALALAVGPVIGGLLVEGIDWRWIFYINVPIGIVGFITVLKLVRESRDETPGQRLDLPGLALGAIATFSAVFALTEANQHGWDSALIVGLFAGAAVAAVLFVVVERRSRSAMLDVRVFRNATFTGANLVGLMVMIALFGTLIYLSIYAQDVLYLSALEAGAVLMPLTVMIMVSAPIGGKLCDVIGPAGPMALGMAIFGSAILLLTRINGDWGVWDLLPGLALMGAGFGLVMPASTAAALACVDPDKTGVASGVLNSFRQLGGAIGIALVGAIVVASVGDLLPGDDAYPIAFMEGASNGLRVVGIIALAGAVVVALTIRGGLTAPAPTEHRPSAIPVPEGAA